MSEPFLAEVRMVGFEFAPRGWARLDGEILPINQNQSLYSLIGSKFGGDGSTSFALPDLRGRTPIHRADQFPIGQSAGTESVTLTVAEMPSHTHQAKASLTAGNSSNPLQNVLAAESGDDRAYRDPEPANSTPLRMGSIDGAGSDRSHSNMQPYLAVTFCIALTGIFPSRN